jgi:enoyl-CoA hydratase
MSILNYSISDSIGFIEISNPPYNSLPDPVFEDEKRLKEFFRTPELKAVIVKGRGRHFCHGADLDALKRGIQSNPDFPRLLDKGKKLLGLLSEATVPVAACIRGGCLGAGLELALSCHFRFAAGTAMLGFPEISLRLMPGFGGTQVNLPMLSRPRLMGLILSGRLVSGEEALSLGIVDATAPLRDIEKKTIDFLQSLVADRSPQLIRSIMQSIHYSRLLPRQEALRRESELFFQVAKKSRVLSKG